ncbi:restriction endonuclease subunit S [Aeribacillus pallidus]|uniref:Type I restriction modification DNA specificity domain-containing protein n=1 Tax=Aeribacillus pallidus TaxID=33936 RepID=A0A223E336_9BACI|nr:restriction endonuclease subunit S [Aeribacillus pallidus]ASS89633.1 hypothetical protein AP3564_04610 [Aeribacillus pallidus]
MKYKIEELCEINSENISKSDDIKYIYYLDTSNLTRGTINELQKLIVGKDKLPSRAKRKVKVNDILISTVRPNQRHYGIIRKEIENLIVSTGFAVLSPNLKKVNPEYLYWYLTQDSIVNYLQSIAETSTSAYPSIKPSVIGGLEIDLPKLEEQKAIANILSTLDEKIETNNKINEKLEEMAQALFKRWFVDFEFPNENGKPYKSSGGEMVESELGMIPKGWEVKTINDISSEIITGKTPSTKEKENFGGNIPFVKIPDMHGKVYVEKTETYLSEKGAVKNKIVPKNSIMVSCIATPGIVSLAGQSCQTNQQINTIINKDNKMCYFNFFSLRNLSDTIRTLGSSGSATLNLNKNQFSKIKIVVPPKEMTDKYFNVVDKIFETIYLNQKENLKLIELRDTLLPKLMSGEIRVPLDDEVLSEKN